MKARASIELIKRRLSKDEREVLRDWLEEINMSYREQIGLRLYLAAASAAYDVLGITGDKLGEFIHAVDEIVCGHSAEVYGRQRRDESGNIPELARDMMEYLRGEGVQCDILEQLYEKVMGRNNVDDES